MGGKELAWDKPLGSQSPPHVMTFKENAQTAFGPFSKRGSSHCVLCLLGPNLPFTLLKDRSTPCTPPSFLTFIPHRLSVPCVTKVIVSPKICSSPDKILDKWSINNQFYNLPWLPSVRLEPMGLWVPTQNFSDDSLPKANSTIKSKLIPPCLYFPDLQTAYKPELSVVKNEKVSAQGLNSGSMAIHILFLIFI